MSEAVSSLWIGQKLSSLEILSIKSFLWHGYNYHLYCYEDIANLPSGVTVMDANEIIEKENIFTYKKNPGKGSYSGFSNYFRYTMLHKRGGIWVDADVVCLREFDLPDYAFAAEHTQTAVAYIPTSCFIKSGANSPFTRYCMEVCNNKNPDDITWGETGPYLVGEAVAELGLSEFVLQPEAVCPIPFWSVSEIVRDGFGEFPRQTFAVHLWNEMWRRKGLDKDRVYPNSLYRSLREKYVKKHVTSKILI